MNNNVKTGKNFNKIFSGVIKMENNNLKNIIVLKNLPSNLIEEAIVILKTNKKEKKIEQIVQAKKGRQQDFEKDSKQYIFKEAEMIVNDFICKTESNNKNKFPKWRKIYSYIITILLFISIVSELI